MWLIGFICLHFEIIVYSTCNTIENKISLTMYHHKFSVLVYKSTHQNTSKHIKTYQNTSKQIRTEHHFINLFTQGYMNEGFTILGKEEFKLNWFSNFVTINLSPHKFSVLVYTSTHRNMHALHKWNSSLISRFQQLAITLQNN